MRKLIGTVAGRVLIALMWSIPRALAWLQRR